LIQRLVKYKKGIFIDYMLSQSQHIELIEEIDSFQKSNAALYKFEKWMHVFRYVAVILAIVLSVLFVQLIDGKGLLRAFGILVTFMFVPICFLVVYFLQELIYLIFKISLGWLFRIDSAKLRDFQKKRYEIDKKREQLELDKNKKIYNGSESNFDVTKLNKRKVHDKLNSIRSSIAAVVRKPSKSSGNAKGEDSSEFTATKTSSSALHNDSNLKQQSIVTVSANQQQDSNPLPDMFELSNKVTKLPKLDYSKLNKLRNDIGYYGELFVIRKEKNRLSENGKPDESSSVVHVSLHSDVEGYDIISFTEDGQSKYIEVKTTTGNQHEPFYLSANELNAMEKLNNYWIYRVYNFDLDLKSGDIYKIDCRNDIRRFYDIIPNVFKVIPKK
jgi:hypothetical protein